MKTISENLEFAINTIESVPEERVNLDTFRSSCGTNACLAAWLCSTPYFSELGMKLEKQEDSSDKHQYRLASVSAYNYEFLDNIFGKDAFDILFSEYGQGDVDYLLMKIEFSEHDDSEVLVKEVSHKQLALLRLKYQLNLVESES